MKLRKALPVSLFGAVLGLCGLANDWRAAHKLWQLPAWPGECIAALGVAVWCVCVVLYAAKWCWLRQEALEEARHPIQCCFISLVPVSTMLAALALQPYSDGIALVLYIPGAVGALTFSAWRQGALLKGARELGTATPVLYLPSVAANFVTAIGAGAFGWMLAAQAFLGAGLLSWLAIESVLLHRFLHGEPLPKTLRPTFGIQLAPPAVGLVALVAATDSPPTLFATILLGYGILQVLIAARLLGWLLEGGFVAGFWSFTFGMTALALGAEKLASGGHELASWCAPLLFVLANGVVAAVAMRSALLLAQGRLLPIPALK
jgi:tellurite resistance protein